LSSSLLIEKRPRTIPVNTRLLRTITTAILKDICELEDFDLAIYIVRASEMACLNETFLNHEGSTDVITFDYSDNASRITHHASRSLHGEIFISIDDAIAQARQFRTTWQSELARYVIHGILHLQGFDDLRAADRRKMKRQENCLLKQVAQLFPLRKLDAASKLKA
jgi:probable rRNA maturation factor